MDAIETPGEEIAEIDTRPISKEEFFNIMAQYTQVREYERLPLPAFFYETDPRFKGTELERLNENASYARKQEKASPEEREINMKERLRRKLEQRKQQK